MLLTDPKGNVTSWTYDVEGRPTQKMYQDTSTLTYTYENTTSGLKSVLDALGQTRQYSYAEDNLLTGITYLNAVNPTPNVAFAYDPSRGTTANRRPVLSAATCAPPKFPSRRSRQSGR